MGVYCISVVVAYILHLSIEAPVIAGDAFLFKRSRRNEICRSDGEDSGVKEVENFKEVERKEIDFRAIVLNPLDLKQIHKL